MPSGFTLAVCLILPLFRFCDGSLPPIIAPPICWPYYVGFVIAVAAVFHARDQRTFAIVLRVVIACFAVVWTAGLAERSSPSSTIAIVVSAIALLFSWWPGPHECVVARSGFVVGGASIVWFATIMGDHDILFGAQVALASSIGMTIGCAWWWWEAQRYASSR